MATSTRARASAVLGGGYTLCTDACDGALAIATSERGLHVLDWTTLKTIKALGTLAHTDRINELCFSSSHTLYSASSDGLIKVWDPSAARCAPVAEISNDDGTEVWSVSVAPSSHLLAAGTETAVVLWDLRRTARPYARYEVHTEAVTQVRFRPGGGEPLLLSGSMDGLLCELDCSTDDEDEAVVGVHNTESPITALGFWHAATAGADAEVAPLASRAWVLSSTDVLSLWDLNAAEQIGRFADLVPHR